MTYKKYNTPTKAPIWYKSLFIHHASKNSSGIKYYCYTSEGIKLGDTLQGIKKLITAGN